MDSTKKQSDKKKIVVVLSRVPAKLDKGDKLRAFNQIKSLSKQYTIFLICLNTEGDAGSLKRLETYCSQIKIFKLSKFSVYWNLFKMLFSNKPFQVGYFYNSKVKSEMGKLIKEFNPDHIYAQLIRTTEYVKNLHEYPKTLDYMDAFSKGIERRISDVPFYLKPFYSSENRRLLKYESLIFDYFDHKTIISEVDREFIFHIDKSKIGIVTNGIDDSFFSNIDKSLNPKNILFTGNMAYPPNVKAAEFILNELRPELTSYSFTIAGANPGANLLKFKSENVEITGWVEDIKSYYEKGRIFIAPMFIGTGIQNKLLEAMAMGIPCITTTLANKPLKAKPEECILIANTKEEFNAQIERVNSDKELYEKLVANAKTFVKENYSWDTSTNELIRIMDI